MSEHKGPDFGALTIPQAILINAFIIAVAVVIAAFIINHGPFDTTARAGRADTKPAAAVVDMKNISFNADTAFIGDPKAKGTIVYWSDFQCPYCKKFEQGTINQVVEQYVKTGKVKIVLKDFAFLGDDSQDAALYSHAVWNIAPELYWSWRESMYAAQDGENEGFGDEASIVALSKGINGLDIAKVQQLVKQRKLEYLKIMDQDKAEASAAGLSGTPGVIIGGTAIPGAVPFATIQKAIDSSFK